MHVCRQGCSSVRIVKAYEKHPKESSEPKCCRHFNIMVEKKNMNRKYYRNISFISLHGTDWVSMSISMCFYYTYIRIGIHFNDEEDWINFSLFPFFICFFRFGIKNKAAYGDPIRNVSLKTWSMHIFVNVPILFRLIGEKINIFALNEEKKRSETNKWKQEALKSAHLDDARRLIYVHKLCAWMILKIKNKLKDANGRR